MGVISYLLTLVLIYGLLVSNFGYMGDASRDASMLSSWDKVTTHDFSHKLKVVSHKGSASPPPPPKPNRPATPNPPPCCQSTMNTGMNVNTITVSARRYPRIVSQMKVRNGCHIIILGQVGFDLWIATVTVQILRPTSFKLLLYYPTIFIIN